MTNIRSVDVVEIFKAPLHYGHAVVIPVYEDCFRRDYSIELSGMLGFDVSGKLVGANAKDQTLKALDNIAIIIARIANESEIQMTKFTAIQRVVATRVDVVNLSQNGKLVNEAYIESGILPVA